MKDMIIYYKLNALIKGEWLGCKDEDKGTIAGLISGYRIDGPSIVFQHQLL